MITQILEKAHTEEEVRIDVFSRLLHNRIIFINDFINDKIASDVVATLFHLDRQEQAKITVFINSEGGDIRNVFMIYDTMRLLSSPLETICIGSAMRESVLLLAAGTKGQRLISKNADIGISQIMHMGISQSDLTNTKISHEKLQRDNDTFLKELAKCIQKSFKSLKKDTERQLFLTPQKAIDYGVVDQII